ncbi:MAG: thioredoxin [Chitinophagaceae bacterium]
MSKFQELINGEVPVLVDFHAEWCGPCKMMAPELKKLASITGDSIKIIKVDVDQNQQASMAFQVNSVPTLILFHKGKQIWRQSGALTANQLISVIERNLNTQKTN